MDIVQSDERVIKSAERNVSTTPSRLVKLDQGIATTPFMVDDAQQSDAASGIDTQSGCGSEMNDELETKCGGEATTTIIDEINNND